MEHQAAQHQQYVTLEGIENSNARALVVKGINVLLTLLQVEREVKVIHNNRYINYIEGHLVDSCYSCPNFETFP